MVNDLMIYNAVRVDPAFTGWSYEKLVMTVHSYLYVVDKEYFSKLETLDAIVTDIKKACGLIKEER